MEERHTNTQFKEIFCGSNGYLSSKRVLGAIVLLTVLGVVVAEACREGVTDNIKSLIEYLIVTATCLLGLTSVTSIFKNNQQKTTE